MSSTTFFCSDAPRRDFSRAFAVLGFLAYAGLLVAAWWMLSRFAPDHVSLRVAGHTISVNNIHQKILGNLALAALVLPAALWLEWAIVGWQRSSARALLKPSATVKTDLACFILDQLHVMGLMGRIMMLGASVLSGVALRDWLAAKTGLAIDPSHLPLAAQVLIYFYVYSFFDYWAHRLGHARLFWPLHRYHHSAEEMSVLNAERIHPACFAGIFFINIPLPVLGATPEAMIWVNVVTVALGYLIHSRIPSGFGWVGRYLVQSPLHHRLHHKLDMTDATGFFAMAPVWDHLFGGWSETRDADVAIGVDTHYRQGAFVLPDLLRDYHDFWLGLIGKRTLSPSER